MLWDQDKTRPAELPEDCNPKGPEKKKQKKPPPIRADPEREKRDKGPGPDGGDGGNPGPGSSTDRLLLQMWKSTLEMRG